METKESKEIMLGTSTKDWYYTVKEHDTVVEDTIMRGKCTITGICRQEANIGDIIVIGIPPKLTTYTIESIKKRNHSGVFKNKKDAENSYFEAETSFSRLINIEQ